MTGGQTGYWWSNRSLVVKRVTGGQTVTGGEEEHFS